MRKLTIPLLCLLPMPLSAPVMANNPIKGAVPKAAEKVTIKARVTYWSHREAGYFYGRCIASDPKGIAIEGRTAAVDRLKIPYGTRISIPALREHVQHTEFVAEDTGSAVIAMKAIPRKKRKDVNIVIDVYVDSIKKMRKLASEVPQYLDVVLEPPKA